MDSNAVPSPWGQLTYLYRCGLIFILFTTGIPEPSDRECREGSHSLYLKFGILITKKNNHELFVLGEFYF